MKEFKDEYVTDIYEIYKSGISYPSNAFCEKVYISNGTFKKWRKEIPEFKAAIEQGKYDRYFID